jgi:glycerol-3-phosphate dehydrogenase
MPPVTFDRTIALRRLADEQFDVLVVGGGITGVGCALDAAARGLRTALVEKDDFASGTSSRSSKFVHGGLRYLQQGDVRLVYEALRERRRLMRNAPHLVQVLPFLLPMFGKGGIVPAKVARVLGTSMWMYDVTGGARIGKVHKRLSAAEAHAHMPTLRRGRLVSAYLYYDAAADDARLTLTIARTAALEHGAVLANGCRLVAVRKDAAGRVCGAVVEADGERIDVTCRAIVNAAGVWADEVRTLDEGHDPDTIRQAKGVHVVLPRRLLGNDIAVILPVPGDRRSIFVAPWGDHAYIGTTDTDDDGPPDTPRTTSEEVDYLLGAVNASLAEPVSSQDVVGTWAGLRPLVRGSTARTADLSRRHQVVTSPSGVVTVIGGKLTTYRQMAEDTIDAVQRSLGVRRGRCPTVRLRLVGAGGHEPFARSGDPVRTHLAGRYGGEAAAVLGLTYEDATLAEPLVPGLPYLKAEAVYAVRAEMARSVDDVLSRRTRARLLDRAAAVAAADAVADLVGPILGWSEDEKAKQVKDFRATVAADHDLVRA